MLIAAQHSPYRATLAYSIWSAVHPLYSCSSVGGDRHWIKREIYSSGLWYLWSGTVGKSVMLSFHTRNILIYSMCYQIQTVLNYVLKAARFTKLIFHVCVRLVQTLTRMHLLQIK